MCQGSPCDARIHLPPAVATRAALLLALFGCATPDAGAGEGTDSAQATVTDAGDATAAPLCPAVVAPATALPGPLGDGNACGPCAADADCVGGRACVDGRCHEADDLGGAGCDGVHCHSECFNDGLCLRDGDRCVAWHPADCRASVACRISGHCALAKDRCVAACDADCAASFHCHFFEGLCGVAAGRCQATVDAHCQASGGCKWGGKCSAVQGTCQAASDGDCADSIGCRGHGACVAKDGACVVAAGQHCKASAGCKYAGACTAEGAACVVGSDQDCADAQVCKHSGYCSRQGAHCGCASDEIAPMACDPDTRQDCACNSGSDCDTSLCLRFHWQDQQKRCSRSCIDTCPCGMKCVSTMNSEGFNCVPSHSVELCRPCSADSQCAGYFGFAQNACVRYQSDPVLAYCGEACKGDADCSVGFGCRQVERVNGGAVLQCVRVDASGERVPCPEVPPDAP
jgi:hypothetical protein